ncbi:hypothetical protein CCZ01_01735 [Helicobacter monodelphidis]|uniref:hypothetical protein n=1 Tax=Helicobacter sp. 15-1451 TaxID=2004995 RepID=UPI000DCE0FBA|nr:hypothetical protein [Helicobacter sp. 15-1451]RAX58938.1 hypothetical protein CCZ01_01735 [Helicobacter sp. 15-1451]
MWKVIFILFCLSSFSNAQWVMFADQTDTYIYNNQTGEVYVRHKRGGENYNDLFVRMPNGAVPNSDGSINVYRPANTPTNPSSKPTAPSVSTPNAPDSSTSDHTRNANKILEEANKQLGNMLFQGQ